MARKTCAAKIVLIMLYLGIYLILGMESKPGRQSDSLWTLDPFLGAYDMDLSTEVDMIRFSNGVLGVPTEVVAGGERQIFGITADGSKYTQTVARPGANSEAYNSELSFALGVKETTRDPSNPAAPVITYILTMANETTLKGDYTFAAGDRTMKFSTEFVFSDSGFSDSVFVQKPTKFVATALFKKI